MSIDISAKSTWDLFSEYRISFIHVIGIEHLMSLISAQIKSFLEVAIAQLIKVDDSAKSYLVIGFFVLNEFNPLTFFFGRGISEPRCVDKHIFWESLYGYDFFFVLDVECIEVPPKSFLLEPLKLWSN